MRFFLPAQFRDARLPPRAGGARHFIGDARGTAALELALLMLPFLTLLMAIIQLGIYFMAQAALDGGVLRTADQMRIDMQAGASYVAPSSAALKSEIQTYGDVMLNGATLVTDIRQLVNLDSSVVPIADGTIDVGGSGSVLVLRARVPVFGFVPGMTSLTVTSIAVVRRPEY